MRDSLRGFALFGLIAIALSCGDSHSSGGAGSCSDPAIAAGEPLCPLDTATTRCEFLNEAHCLLPYPSSLFLVADATTDTGLRVDYPREALPANNKGVHIDPTEWNTLDGFSPGPVLAAHFTPQVDLVGSHVPSITAPEDSLGSSSPVVLVEASSGARVPLFGELDAQTGDAARQAFLIRPQIRLHDGARYVVGIRGLVAQDGTAIAPSRAFRILRDKVDSPVKTINDRRAAMEDVFRVLEAAGVARGDLILAWDFTVASTGALTGRMLSLRDQGLTANGPGAPPFTVTSVEDSFSDRILRRVRGTYTVPLFMNSATPPATYNLDASGTPRQNGTAQAPFTVMIPRLAATGGSAASAPYPAARPIIYGHGLLGSGESEVQADNLQTLAVTYHFVITATDWIGLAEGDVAADAAAILDLSLFPRVPDRLQQAMLNQILLGRLLLAEDGFASDPAFQIDGSPAIDRQEIYYYGNSQGGIEGTMLMALEPDLTRGVIGVGAMNYSLLLQRSVDWTPYQTILDSAYTDPLDRALIYPLIQQLWDRGEPQGYVPHVVSDPLPGTPVKKILANEGINDGQVANISTEIMVRSLGIPNLAPTAKHLFGVPEQAAPFDGSAFVPWDVGATPAPPLTNTPLPEDTSAHEAVRRQPADQQQIDAFLRPDGSIENFCNGPCTGQ